MRFEKGLDSQLLSSIFTDVKVWVLIYDLYHKDLNKNEKIKTDM